MYEKNGICYAGELVPQIEVESIKLLKDGMMLVKISKSLSIQKLRENLPSLYGYA